MSDDLKKLDMRIAKIESMMESVASRPQLSDITPEEMKAFQKVRDAIAFDPDNSCGINECFKVPVTFCRTCRVCQVCQVCRVCKICDFECVCGPCIMSAPGGRFGSLGE